MASQQQPHSGGSYKRRKDGSLERVGGTESTPASASIAPTETIALSETPIADGDGAGSSTKKGK